MIFQKVGPIGFFEFQRVFNLDLWPLVFYNPKMLLNEVESFDFPELGPIGYCWIPKMLFNKF